MSLWVRFKFWVWRQERRYKRWAKKVAQAACTHDFIVTVSWTGRRDFCKKCHLTQNFVPWE